MLKPSDLVGAQAVVDHVCFGFKQRGMGHGNRWIEGSIFMHEGYSVLKRPGSRLTWTETIAVRRVMGAFVREGTAKTSFPRLKREAPQENGETNLGKGKPSLRPSSVYTGSLPQGG